MRYMTSEEREERYDVLRLAFAHDSEISNLIKHYGPDEVDYAERHIRTLNIVRHLITDEDRRG